MGQTRGVGDGERLAGLRDHHLRIDRIQRPVRRQDGAQGSGVGQRLVNDVDHAVATNGVEDPHESRVVDRGGRLCRCHHSFGEFMIVRNQVDPDAPGEHLVGGSPERDAILLQGALLEPVPVGDPGADLRGGSQHLISFPPELAGAAVRRPRCARL